MGSAKKPLKAAHLMLAVIFVVLCASFAKAEIFYDSSLNIYNIVGSICFRSSDNAASWRKVANFSTQESGFSLSENSDGTVFLFSKKEGGSLLSREIGKNGYYFSQPKKILTDYLGDSYSIQVVNGYFHLFYRNNGHIKYSISYDKGSLFSVPQILTGFHSAESWIVNVDKSEINLYYSTGKYLYNVNCPDLSGRFSTPKELYNSANIICNIIPFKKPWDPKSFEIAWVEKTDALTYKLCYLSKNTHSPQILYASNDRIISSDAKSLDEYSLITFNEDNPYNKKILMVRILKSPKDYFLPPTNITQGMNNDNYSSSFPLSNKLAMLADNGGDLYLQYVSSLLLDVNPDAPQIHLIKPEKNSCFKSGATALIYSKITGGLNNIDDEKDAQALIDGLEQENTITYSSEDEALNGMLNLPRSLAEGAHNLTIKIQDNIGIAGVTKVQFNIDNTPPNILRRSIIETPRQISIPFEERISGLDKSSVKVNLYSGTTEVSGKVKIDNNIINFLPNHDLEYGDYNLQYICRDIAGNSTSVECVSINISPSLSNAFSQASLPDSIFVSLSNGPNPFRPLNGEEMVVKYALSQPASINLLIFSLQGDIIYRAAIPSQTTTGEVAWNGRNIFNNISEAGIYPYIVQAQDASGGKYRKRGKIIVL